MHVDKAFPVQPAQTVAGSGFAQKSGALEDLMSHELSEEEANEHNNKVKSPIAVVPLGVINRWLAEGVCTRDMISCVYIATSSSSTHQGYSIVSL